MSSSQRKPTDEEATRLLRLASDLAQAEASTIVLVQAEAGAPELKVRMTGVGADKTQREPDIAASSLGLYLFRTSASEPPQKLLERLSVSGPSALPPSRPLKLRIDALAPSGDVTSLATRELTLPSDGKVVALAP